MVCRVADAVFVVAGVPDLYLQICLAGSEGVAALDQLHAAGGASGRWRA